MARPDSLSIALEPNDERHFESHLLGRGDDARGDDVALHDASEDVDEDALRLGAFHDHAEGLGDLLLIRAAAHVEEVGRAAAVVLDDVHRGHREAGAVHEAADVAVERHVREARLFGLELDWILFVAVAELGPFFVAEVGVVVEGHLGVEGDDFAKLGDDERVDLAEGAVFFHEELVKVRGHGHELSHLVLVQTQEKSHAPRLVSREPDDGIEVQAMNLLRRVVGDLLDVHASLGRRHDGDSPRIAIEHEGEVELASNVEALLDVEAADNLALGAGLVRDERAAEHFVGELARFGGTVLRELDTAPLAATARVDLRLDDDDGDLRGTPWELEPRNARRSAWPGTRGFSCALLGERRAK